MIAFAGIVAFHRNRDYRAQRFEAYTKDAKTRRRSLEWTVEGPDEGLIGI